MKLKARKPRGRRAPVWSATPAILDRPFAGKVGYLMPGLHPFLTGRLARWPAMEGWPGAVLARSGARGAPLEDISARARGRRDRLRTETLPHPGKDG